MTPHDISIYRLGKSFHQHFQMAGLLACGRIKSCAMAGMIEISDTASAVIMYELTERDKKDLIAWRLKLIMARNDRHVQRP